MKAMLYLPKTGHMWDTSILYWQNKYYLFSMFRYFGKDDVNVWCAVSDDGVHFSDVGVVISDQPPNWVWKMFVYRYGDQFVMNFGSFSNREGHGNDTLKFWKSNDLLHWEYCGEQHPDPRWYLEEGRFDHMYTVDDGGEYYGFVVANPKEGGNTSGCGLMKSSDGITWSPLPPVKIEWGDVPPRNFEVGGCEKINGHYYLIGGLMQYFGNDGYSVYTFISDSVTGPYRPCLPKFRLCGNSSGKYSLSKQWLANFARGENDEVLITNYLTAPESETINFVGTKENVWFLPVKKAVIGSDGELMMGYWKKNDLLKGEEIPIDFTSLADDNDKTVYLKTADFRDFLWNSPERLGTVNNAMILAELFDFENGVVFEGSFELYDNGNLSKAKSGIMIKQEQQSVLVSLEVGDRHTSKAQIALIKDDDVEHVEIHDEISNTCAGKTNLSFECVTAFRLLVRQNIFELYIDDILVQSYTLPKNKNGNIGFFVENCSMKLCEFKAFKMDMAPPQNP